MMTEAEVYSDLAIPPGEYLEEVLDDLGMTKGELAKRMGRPAPKLSAIFKGVKAITPDTALQLEKVVGVPAHIWTGLEAEYRLTLEREAARREAEGTKHDRSKITAFCYAELAKLGYVKSTAKPLERLESLREFLGVTSLGNVGEVPRYGLAFRQAKRAVRCPSPEAVIAWLRMGEKTAQNQACEPYDRGRLQSALPEIRALSRQEPHVFEPKLRGILANVGVALVVCPHLPRTYAHGAAFWLGPKKAVVMVTIRGAWADIFWFSLFHELGHVLLHGKSNTFIEFDDRVEEDQNLERQADIFAQDILILRDKYEAFLSRSDGKFYVANTREFARQLGIHPGIVVGRLQHDRHLLPQWQNELRMKLKWK